MLCFPKKPLYAHHLAGASICYVSRSLESARSRYPMESLLVKIFATALAFSQVTPVRTRSRPNSIRSRTSPRSCQLLRAGCAHMRKAFDIEDINLDDLIATAMDDPEAVAGGLPQFRGHQLRRPAHRLPAVLQERDGREFAGRHRRGHRVLQPGGRRTCPTTPGSAACSCPAPARARRKGERFAEVFEPDQRRVWVPLAEIPGTSQDAFIAAEDKRFYQHHGIDERGADPRLHRQPDPVRAGRRAARPSPSRWRRTCWSATTSPTSARSAR